jgi:hypothetical protein
MEQMQNALKEMKQLREKERDTYENEISKLKNYQSFLNI